MKGREETHGASSGTGNEWLDGKDVAWVVVGVTSLHMADGIGA